MDQETQLLLHGCVFRPPAPRPSAGCKSRQLAQGDWELGHCSITLTPTGKRLFRIHSDHVHLQQMQQDQVAAPPTHESSKGLSPETKVECWGKSEHTEVQGLYIKIRFFSSQAHLAFDEDMVRRQIQMREESGGIKDKEQADRARRRRTWSTMVGMWSRLFCACSGSTATGSGTRRAMN